MKTDSKLENCHNRSIINSPVNCTVIKVTLIRPVEISSENYKKGTVQKRIGSLTLKFLIIRKCNNP
jgi:hypothetical protein